MAKVCKMQYALFLAHHVWTHSKSVRISSMKKMISFWKMLIWVISEMIHFKFHPRFLVISEPKNSPKIYQLSNIWGTNGRRTRARGNLSKRTPSSSTWEGCSKKCGTNFGEKIHIQTFRKFRANQPWLSMTLGSWVNMIYTDDRWWSPEDLIPLQQIDYTCRPCYI